MQQPANQLLERADIIAANMQHVPDEAYVSFAAGGVFASVGLFLIGRRDEALFVGLLTMGFATMAGVMKILGEQRGHALRT